MHMPRTCHATLMHALACSRVLTLPRPRWCEQIALVATAMLLATCYALISNALRIFRKFELQ